MITIHLTQGKHAIIDEIDADLASLKWYASFTGYGKPRAVRSYKENGKTKNAYMSRVIGARIAQRDISRTEEVDHINHDTLNNTRANLRIVTRGQNAWNLPISSRNKSGYKGVSFCKQTKRWIAFIERNGSNKNLGRYSTPEDAARAYDAAAKEMFGEYAVLNNV